MITRFTHTTIFVLDQEQAVDFYVNKLGFKIHTDAPMPNGYRWLTLNPPAQPDLEVVIMGILHPSMLKTDENPHGIDAESIEAFRILLNKGILGAGVMHTPDCRATYEELKAKGVRFAGEPREQPYGTEVVMHDDCGNWFSLLQTKG